MWSEKYVSVSLIQHYKERVTLQVWRQNNAPRSHSLFTGQHLFVVEESLTLKTSGAFRQHNSVVTSSERCVKRGQTEEWGSSTQGYGEPLNVREHFLDLSFRSTTSKQWKENSQNSSSVLWTVLDLSFKINTIIYCVTTGYPEFLCSSSLTSWKPFSLLPHSPSNGSTRRSIPQQGRPLLASGCCPPLPAGYGLCCDCHGYPHRRLQRFTWRILYGGMVLLLRHVSRGVLPGRHSSLQLPACVLEQPHGHMRCLCDAHVSHMFRRIGPQLSWWFWWSNRTSFTSFVSVTLSLHLLHIRNLCPPIHISNRAKTSN